MIVHTQSTNTKSCDPRKYNRKNAEFVASAKYTFLENLYEYGSQHAVI